MSLFKRLFTALRTGSVSSDEWDQIRSTLIASDLGAKLVDEVIEKVKSAKPDDAVLAITTHVKSWLSNKSRELFIDSDRLNTVLIVGVNGTGKTTSTAKLANKLTKSGSKVLLAAADTFRAAAVEQLKTWGDRIGVEVVSGKENSDPAAICFDGASRAKSENFDLLIIDTAGRLHTKSNLMDELGKVRRVIEKVTPVNEILFVLDGTTGQNGIAQAKVFSESVSLTGMIVTKIDGSTRGGIALATERALRIPLKFVGVGESITDIQRFDADRYIAELLT